MPDTPRIGAYTGLPSLLCFNFDLQSRPDTALKTNTNLAYQPSFFEPAHLTAAVEDMAAAGIEERGAVFTRPEVVEFILDLAGYNPDQPLHERRALEPSFGGGDFLLALASRLLISYRKHGGTDPAADLADAIRGVELHRHSFVTTTERLHNLLLAKGLAQREASALVNAWLSQGDFLLTDREGTFDFVVGNPPYVRQESIPDILIAEYRRRYATVYDRADLYIPFIERSLSYLKPGGVLGFICADRWMKNKYGEPLRGLIADRYHLRTFVDMVDTPAFLSEVIAYPGIFIIANERGTKTNIIHRPAIEPEALADLSRAIISDAQPAGGVRHVGVLARGRDPWIVDSNGNLDLVRKLEARFPAVEQAGCKVGIGVATGADQAFIGKFDELDVEADRKLPLVMTRDILTGAVLWRGFGVINPFNDAGGLVALKDYPRLAAYLETHKEEIAGRHIAQKLPANWYRTIDRIYPAILGQPKLLIPDIKGAAHIVFEEGKLYPHHNLYFITSKQWDLRALQAILLSGIARLFIAAYSTKMRGGYLRYQAQYLRRIRVPYWKDVPSSLRSTLIEAAERRDQETCNRAAADLYGLSPEEWDILAAKEAG